MTHRDQDSVLGRWDVPVNRTTVGVLVFGAIIVTNFCSSATTLWCPSALALVVSTVAILILKNVAPHLGLIDRPQGHKTHQGDVPVVGGLAMYAGLALALPLTELPSETVIALLSACGLLVTVGAIDDRFHLPVWVRFAAQVGAALIMIYWGGVVLVDLGQLVSEETLTLGRWSVPLTVVATVGVINSMNMSDGLDGLAGSLALVTLAVAAALAISGNTGIAIVAMTGCAMLIGFLAFNAPLPGRHPRARLFMGDAGSMMLGLLIAWTLISLAQGPNRAIAPVTALWLFAIPLLDTLSVMLRRMRRGKSPFSADREHLHHVMMFTGFSERIVVLIAFAGAIVFAGFGLLLLHAGVPEYWQFAIATGVLVLTNITVRKTFRQTALASDTPT